MSSFVFLKKKLFAFCNKTQKNSQMMVIVIAMVGQHLCGFDMGRCKHKPRH